MVKVTKPDVKIVSPLFLLSALILVGLIYNLNRDPFGDIRSRAEEDDPNFCQNHCKPSAKRCDFNDTTRHEDDPIINDPCCEEIGRTGDPLACPWPQRGYCTDNQCAAIPEGVSRQRCGGPRHSWCNLCNEKCPGSSGSGPTVPTSIPVLPTAIVVIPAATVVPTEVPIPTQIPTLPPPPPTQVVWPTQTRPQITYIPVVIPPYIPPTATPTTIPFKLNLPNILPPKEKVDSFFATVKTNLLDFLSKILP